MDRLTSKRPWEEALKDLPHELGYSHIWKRLREIEDILGDDYDLGRLQELMEADRESRVRIAGRPPLEDECCGNCGHFRRIAGTRRGDCSVHGYIKNRLGQEDRSRGRFTPFQSRKACRKFQRRTDDDGRSDPEG